MSPGTTNSGATGMTCEQVVRGEVTEKYVLGQLSEAEQQAFEQHYFECARCFDELETYRGLQEGLKQAAPVIQRESVAQRAVFPWMRAAAAAGVLLAIGIGYWLERPRPASPPPSARPIMPAPKVQRPPATRVPSLSELAEVRPPSYTPVVLRGPSDEATQRFHKAMQHYMKRDYAGAIPGLRVASKLSPKAADINFFLGICYLLTEQTDAAIGQLRRTSALGDSPYVEEAYFYLAKAYLRKSDLESARRELKKAIEFQQNHKNEARELLDHLEELSKPLR